MSDDATSRWENNTVIQPVNYPSIEHLYRIVAYNLRMFRVIESFYIYPKSIDTEDNNVRVIIDMYLHGKGCVSIAMTTGVALSSVIDIVKIAVCDGRQPRM